MAHLGEFLTVGTRLVLELLEEQPEVERHLGRFACMARVARGFFTFPHMLIVLAQAVGTG
jgi:hypothetical protein